MRETNWDEALDARIHRQRQARVAPALRSGRVVALAGEVVVAELPLARVGELWRVRGEQLVLEVVGFGRDGAALMPLGPLTSLAHRSELEPIGETPTVPAGDGVSGRILDALGHPIDFGSRVPSDSTAPLQRRSPRPLGRAPVHTPVPTGVRAIDGLLPVGRGQRMGIFAGAGTGKSTLLGALARHVEADHVVVALVGERGCEVGPFIEENLGEQGLQRATVVVSTSDESPLLRMRAALTATAIAEAERDKGKHVVLLVDSLTRFARAARDVGLGAGEAPGRQGYPPSVATALARLVERAGATRGEGDRSPAITAFYTVLVAGDDLSEPIADECKSLLDGHLLLSSALAARGHYPAIDVAASESRAASGLDLGPGEPAGAVRGGAAVREAFHFYDSNHELITMGLVSAEDDRPRRLLGLRSEVERFLRQDLRSPVEWSATRREVEALGAQLG